MNQLLLVDGHAYAYRAFYAIREMFAPDGQATNAIFGFIKMLERASGLVQPTHQAVVWDGGLDAERVDALPGYKGLRAEMPDSLAMQLDHIQGYLEAAGILSVWEMGMEADDLIGAITRKASAAGWKTVIATSDKDFMQLVSPEVRLLNPGDKQQPIWGVEKVIAKTGVRPAQVVDWLSLVGDTVDNIDGVPGVGPKTAAKLLNEFETIDGIYQCLDQVKSERLRIALNDARSLVLRNRALVALKVDLDSAPEPGDCQIGQQNRLQLRKLFEAWGFRSMAERYMDEPAPQELPL